jgi:hypothetical protein
LQDPPPGRKAEFVSTVANVIVAVIALLHVYILVLD